MSVIGTFAQRGASERHALPAAIAEKASDLRERGDPLAAELARIEPTIPGGAAQPIKLDTGLLGGILLRNFTLL